MHFLLINQFFAPDPAPTGQLLADVARALVANGHSVAVVCSRARYGAVDKAGDPELEQVLVHRLAGFSFGRNHILRLASYAAFYAGALKHVLVGRKPDAVLTLTTPPLLSLVGTLAKKLRASKHFIWEMDVYPDVAVALKVFRSGSSIEKLVGALADFSRRHSDGVVALGPCMLSLLVDRGIPAEKVTVAENWVDGSAVAPRPFPPNSPLTILYSGNLGLAHDVATIAGAMTRLGNDKRFRFVFAGGGPRRHEIESRCNASNLQNVTFLPYQDSTRLSEHLGSCHIGLVTQEHKTCGAAVPSKTYALMAAGRPFIFIGPGAATPAANIRRFQCGWHVEPENVSDLVHLLESLANQPDRIRAAGQFARNAFDNNYERRQGVDRIIRRISLEGAPAEKHTAASA